MRVEAFYIHQQPGAVLCFDRITPLNDYRPAKYGARVQYILVPMQFGRPTDQRLFIHLN